MTSKEIKEALARAARKAWPSVAKASDLPFPDYWRNKVDWLTFHAPHIGDKIMRKLIDDAVRDAVLAEAAGKEPVCPPVPASVKKIWENHALPGPAQQACLTDSTNTTTCGDGGRDHDLISPKGGLGSAAPDRQCETKNSGGRPERRPMKQGRLL